tara:strand:+ start:19 stop:147 length:129 start_codon:yes stop_codon:yes gene_type:complete
LLQQQLPDSGVQEQSFVPSQAHLSFTQFEQLHLELSHAMKPI